MNLAKATAQLLLVLLLAGTTLADDSDLTLCQGACPIVPGEMLLTTATVTHVVWTKAPPDNANAISNGYFDQSPWPGGHSFQWGNETLTDVLVGPLSYPALVWVNGDQNGCDWELWTIDSSYPSVVDGFLTPGGTTVSPDLPKRSILHSGQVGAFDVKSEIDPLNGRDIKGMGIHIDRFSITTGPLTSTYLESGYFSDQYTTLRYQYLQPITIRLYAAPGEFNVPEPASASLIALGVVGLCARYRVASRPPARDFRRAS